MKCVARSGLALLVVLAAAAPGPAQKSKRQPARLELAGGKFHRDASFNLEYRVPETFRPLQDGHGFGGRDGFFTHLQKTGGIELEKVREGLVAYLQKSFTSARFQSQLGLEYGGMECIAIQVKGLPHKGQEYRILNLVNVPAAGVVRLDVGGPEKRAAEVEKLNRWVMASFRLLGDEGDDLVLARREVDRKTGLSYRVPRGTRRREAAAPEALFEGRGPGNLAVRIGSLQGSGKSLTALVREWGAGARAVVKPRKVKTRSDDAEAVVALFRPHGGEPQRALAAFRPPAGRTFRLEVAGRDHPLVHLHRMISTVEWLDLPALEKEVRSWRPEVEAALKTGQDRVLKRFARRLAERFYLKASLALARDILKKGPENAQVPALECIGRGGHPIEDLKNIRIALSNARFRDRTKMRQECATALGQLEDVKTTNFLLRLMRDRDSRVARAAVLALGEHRSNRKKSLPRLIGEWKNVLRARQSRDAKKQLRLSRVGDACRVALRKLTGEDLKDPKAAEAWLHRNRKILAEEVLKELGKQ